MEAKNYNRREFLKVLGKGVVVSIVLPSLWAEHMSASSFFGHKMKNGFDDDVNQLVAHLNTFTARHKEFHATQPMRCEIECMKIQYPLMFCEIEENDLFVGRAKYQGIALSPQAFEAGGYCADFRALEKLKKDERLTTKNKEIVQLLIDYWRKENGQAQTRTAFPPQMSQILYTDGWMEEPVAAAPLYRMSGTQCDYDKLCRLGIDGLRKEIKTSRKAVGAVATKEQLAFWDALEQSLDLFAEIALWFADKAAIAQKMASGNRKKQLLQLEETLRKITTQKPESLHEGIQLVFLWAVLSGSINYGRMDEYLGDLYVKEIDEKRMTEEDAIQMLSNLWLMIDSRGTTWDARVIVGGKGRRNESNANRFALAAMETTKRVKGITPQFTLRFDKEQDPVLYQTALNVIGTGNPYPMLYNDDVNIPAVMNAFKVPYEEAINYLPFGCGEYILYHRSVGTPSGVINLAQVLNITLHKGLNSVSGRQEGIALEEYTEFNTFEDLLSCYKKNVEHYVTQLAFHEKLEYDIIGGQAPFCYLSLLFDHCIMRGKPIFTGGIHHLGGTLEAYGNTNTADSLTAIKKLVYEDKKMSMQQLLKILDADFKGFDRERRMMLNAPKYGNDDDYADKIRVEIDAHLCNYTRNMGPKAGLDSYLIVIINNNANVTMGENTPATADGRKAFTFLANANAATGGADKNGITAYLNSIVKPDVTIHAGAVQNMAFSKETFNVHRSKTEALLTTYFDRGGAQAMINCLGRGDLEAAMKNPENYQNLIVRVGGFSARFVELPISTQREILSRTLY